MKPPLPEDDMVACICEGPTEVAVMNRLLDGGALSFDRERLVSGAPLGPAYFRNPDKFCDQFLAMDYGGAGVSVVVVQDRKTATYRIKPAFSGKVSAVVFAVTAPEIEMLAVHALGLYDEYKKTKAKPSAFLASSLKRKSSSIKERSFVEGFWSEHDIVAALRQHRSKSQALPGKNMCFLADLLRS